MAAIDSAAITRFRNSVAAALAISDKSAFDDATRTLSLATRTPDVFSLPEVQTDPQLSKLLSLAADLHWFQPSPRTPTTWASILKRTYHPSTQPPSQPSTTDLSSPSPSSSSSRLVSSSNLTPTVATQQQFVPPIPSQPVALPIMVAPTAGGVRPSFRSWKWHRAAPPSSIPTFGQPHSPIAATNTAAAAAAAAALSSGAFDETWLEQSRPILGHVERYISKNDSNEDLLSTMRMTPATQAAGVTTAAAFQALKPFLEPEQRKALRNSIAYAQPLHALDAVVESVHAFCEPLVAGEANASASTNANANANQSSINVPFSLQSGTRFGRSNTFFNGKQSF